MRIALIGYGKMGKAIEEIALEKKHEIVLRISSANIHEFTDDHIRMADVAIEFSNPHSALENVMKCISNKVPVVCGSTGWTDQQPVAIEACKSSGSALLIASNFSIGVNIFFEVNRRLAQLMSAHNEYDVSIEEIHHTAKKDAPSGTAITLAEDILRYIQTKKQWVNERSTTPSALSVISKRIDPAPGTHIIRYTSPVDDIEITHTAHNRKGFAAGALLAAEFLHGKKGIYYMKDVLGI